MCTITPISALIEPLVKHKRYAGLFKTLHPNDGHSVQDKTLCLRQQADSQPRWQIQQANMSQVSASEHVHSLAIIRLYYELLWLPKTKPARLNKPNSHYMWMVNTILPVERRLPYINKNYDMSCAKVSGELNETHANLATVFVHMCC